MPKREPANPLSVGLFEVVALLALAQRDEADVTKSMDYLNKFVVPGLPLTDFGAEVVALRRRELVAAVERVTAIMAVRDLVLAELTARGVGPDGAAT